MKVKGEPLAERKMQPDDVGLDYLELLRRGRHRGYLLVSPSLIVEHERVNIIQHPNGNPQKAVLTQNYVLSTMSADRVHYLADTMPGSSARRCSTTIGRWSPCITAAARTPHRRLRSICKKS